ncbi:MAG TPA: DNA repair exonuclease [Pirellulaceae bacterium]|nr:DNA repair exonuclease [Pirellulaceae bacterium]
MSNSPHSFSFIHCADLHLDSPFEGIQDIDPNIGTILRDSTFKSFERIVSLAIEENVDFIVIAGDVYDSAYHSLRAQIRFRDAIKKVSDAGISCFIAHGNHDPLDSWDAKLGLPINAHRFGGDTVCKMTASRDGRPLADIYGVSFPTRIVNENIAARFAREHDGVFAIGVLHCNLGGHPEHDNYAPCTLDDLRRANLNYWALGHVHTRSEWTEQETCVVYPGNIQGRNVRETGERGCYLVNVREDQTIKLQFVPTDEVRWFAHDEANLDLRDIESFDTLLLELSDILERLRVKADGRASIARIRLYGRSDLHTELMSIDLVRDLIQRLREGERDRRDFVWTESIRIATLPTIDIAQRRLVDDFVGDYLKAAEELRSNGNIDLVRQMMRDRPEGRNIITAIDEFSDAELLEVLSDAELLGLNLLLSDND